MAKLLFQGHGSYRITTEDKFVIYVDPYAGEGYEVPADLVLITHEHTDHNDSSLVTLKEDGQVCRSADFLQDGQYKTMQFAGEKITVTATPAYNDHHKKEECVGYLLRLDGVTIYGAGDTSTTEYMSEVLAGMEIDYALLPIDGVFNMGIREAGECARIIGAKHTIPIHMKPGRLFDQKTAESFVARGRKIVRPGEEIRL